MSEPGSIQTHFCHLPSCLKKREERGQENGRFLLEYWQDSAVVYVKVICQDCGTHYVVMIPKTL